MYPRKRLEISWTDLAFGGAACLRPESREAEARRLEHLWSPGGDVLACLSVRSGFGLLLEALALPPGSEVLVSAVTIRDMVRIIRHHGLVPVPVDMDMKTLSVCPSALERAVGPRSRAILVAHLFGSRMPLDTVAAFARERELLLLEDCAQAFMGDGYRGHSSSDVVLFSFGPIKSRTALGGGLVQVGNPALLARMRGIQDDWPVRSRGWFLARILKYAGISLLLTRTGLRLLRLGTCAVGVTHDDVLSGVVRGFPGPRFFGRIRQRPPYPLLALLRRRLRTLRPGAFRRRSECGRTAATLMPWMERPGSCAPVHSHWVFPACPGDPDGLMRRLWSAGFDATRGASSLAVVPASPSRPEVEAFGARDAMSRVLYLPVGPGLPTRALLRLVREVAEHEGRPMPLAGSQGARERESLKLAEKTRA